MTEQRSIQGYVDAITPAVAGWVGFAAGSDAPAEGALALSLMIGDDRIGTVGRAMPRPDVDAFLGYAGMPKGFSVAAGAVAAFATMTGLANPAILAESDSASSLVIDFEPEPTAPLGMVETRMGWAVQDLWFSSKRHLVLRFERRGHAGPCRAAAFQRRLDDREDLVRLSVPGRLSGDLGTLTLEVFNPFLPLLLVLYDDGDVIVATDWIPFPSLVRNGLHACEVDALADGGDRIGDLVRVSADLANACRARRTAAVDDRLRCDAIRFVADGCTGTEAMFDADLTDMITGLLGVTIRVSSDDPETGMAALLASQIRQPSAPPAAFTTTVHLPGDAVPTLSVLLQAAFHDAGQGRSSSAFIRLPDPLDRHAWLVTPPATRAEPALPTLQMADDTAGVVLIPGPVAIRIGGMPTRMTASTIFPRATDAIDTVRPTGPVSIVIAAPRADEPPFALLQSIAEQSGFDDGEVVYGLRAGQMPDAVEPALQALFPGRHRIVPHDMQDARLRELRHLAGFATHPTLVLLDPTSVLHDTRALARLTALLDGPDVGTATCLLVRPNGAGADFACAGYFLSQVDFRRLPSLSFDTPDPRGILDPDYDVAAAPLSALAIRKDVLAMLPGPHPGSVIIAAEEIRLGLDVLRLGLRNIVTTRCSIATTRGDLRPTGLAVTLPLMVGCALLERIIDGATGLQRL